MDVTLTLAQPVAIRRQPAQMSLRQVLDTRALAALDISPAMVGAWISTAVWVTLALPVAM